MPDSESNPESKADSEDQRAYRTLRDKAYRLLARREHSASELRRKLRKSVPDAEHPQAVDGVVAELAEHGAQSDFRFAEQHCRRRFQNGRGPLKLRHELAQHQIAEAIVTRVMAEFESEWRALAGAVRRKKFGDAGPADYREWARQARFLQQRGFAPEQIEPFAD